MPEGKELAFSCGSGVWIIVGILESLGEIIVGSEIGGTIGLVEVRFEPVRSRPRQVGGSIRDFGCIRVVARGVRAKDECEFGSEAGEFGAGPVEGFRIAEFWDLGVFRASANSSWLVRYQVLGLDDCSLGLDDCILHTLV